MAAEEGSPSRCASAPGDGRGAAGPGRGIEQLTELASRELATRVVCASPRLVVRWTDGRAPHVARFPLNKSRW